MSISAPTAAGAANTPTPTPLPTPTPKPLTAQEILQASKDALNAAGTYHFDLNGTVAVDVPSLGIQMDMPMTMAGDVQSPDRMQGSLTMTVMSNTMTTEMIVIGSEAWAQDPITGEWVAGTQAGAPVDPTQFTDLSESELAGMAVVGEETLDGEQVVHLTGTVHEELNLGAELGGPMQLSLAADYWIAKESNLPLKATMAGSVPVPEPVEMTVGMSMTIEFSGFGEPVTIESPPTPMPTPTPAPAATVAQVTQAPSPASLHPDWASYTNANFVVDLAFDADGGLWAVGSGGAVRWDLGGGTYTKYTVEQGLASNWLNAVAVAPDGAVWFGSEGGGVSRFDGDTWTTYTQADGLASNDVNAVAVAPDGAVWFSTDGGASRFDGKAWTTYTLADGLASDTVGSIAIAPDGAVWFATSGGVSRYQPPQ
jgi:hypothetical protein